MKAANLKIIKAMNAFMKEYFPKFGNYNLSSSETSKVKDSDKGNFVVNIDIKPDDMPDILDTENYSTIMKKKLETILKKEIRWFSINWNYHTDPDSIVSFSVAFHVA
jgi:enoyl reductase-like protein